MWVCNLRSSPDVTVQDGIDVYDMTAREVTGAEKAEWWKRATDAYPPYDEYQAKTERIIPLFVLEPRS